MVYLKKGLIIKYYSKYVGGLKRQRGGNRMFKSMY